VAFLCGQARHDKGTDIAENLISEIMIDIGN